MRRSVCRCSASSASRSSSRSGGDGGPRMRHALATAVSFFTSNMATPASMREAMQWRPQTNKLHGAMRDAGYMVIDLPFFIARANSNYGAFRRYLRQARLHRGKVSPEEFANVDTNILRHMLSQHRRHRGPLSHIDLRVINWIYFVVFGCVMWQGMKLKYALDARIDHDGSDGSGRRRSLYSDDYIEDVRTR